MDIKKIALSSAVILLLAAGCNKTGTNSNTDVSTDNSNTMTSDTDNGGGENMDMDNGTGTTANTNLNVNAGTSVNTNTSVTGQTKTFTVEGSNFKFSPSDIRVKEGDTVIINFKNTGGIHDFVIDAFNARTKQITGGAAEAVTFVASKKGTFEFYCSVGNHRQMGMKGNLIVE